MTSAIYQRILDYAGKRKKKDQPLVPASILAGDEPSSQSPTTISYPPAEATDPSLRMRIKTIAADSPASEIYRTAAGDLQAELGDYKRAGQQWDQLLRLGAGDKEVYLNAATVFWDYFQYDDALRVMRAMRRQMRDNSLHAFQIAAILESKHQIKEAIAEYAKDLNENSENYGRARRRLAALWKRKGHPQLVRTALNRELSRAAGRESFVMGCVELFQTVEREDEASALLKREIARSRKRTSGQAYKDYRWNLVLARIYDAKSDWASATRELRKAITNQPEMIELHAELARVYTSAKDYDAAIKTLNHILKMTNCAPCATNTTRAPATRRPIRTR